MHTPKPWESSRDAVPEGHVQSTVYSEATGERVATVFASEDNVSLIVAAPELLEACEAVLYHIEHDCEGNDTADILRAAIAKARGAQ